MDDRLKLRVYAKINAADQLLTNDLECPDGWILMQNERPDGYWHAKPDGKWHPGDPTIEAEFVIHEQSFITEQILMHKDDDPAAIATEQAWRDYRKELRLWCWDNCRYPDPAYRPLRPS